MSNEIIEYLKERLPDHYSSREDAEADGNGDYWYFTGCIETIEHLIDKFSKND
jgi:hypothetical protein